MVSVTERRVVKVIFCLLLIIVMAGLGAIGLLLYRDLQQPDQIQQDPKVAHTSNIVAGGRLFETNEFTLTTDPSWRYLEELSEPGRVYLYGQFEGGVPEAYFHIFLDDQEKREYERVMPVVHSGQGLRPTAGVSDHCSGQQPDKITTGQRAATIAGVSFTCNVDGNSYTVGLGLEGGSMYIPFPRASSERTMTIFYKDVRFTPDPAELESLLGGLRFK